MYSNEAILIILIVVLIMVGVYQMRKDKKTEKYHTGSRIEEDIRGHINHSLSETTGCQSGCQSGCACTAKLDVTDMADQYKRSHRITPETLEEAQQAAWTSSLSDGANRDIDPSSNDEQQYHNVGTALDYGTYLTDTAIDERTHNHHRNWAHEMKDISQTSRNVDDMDEAVAMGSQPRTGITAFRLNAPAQGPHTMFITEADPHLYSDHFARRCMF